MRLTFRSVTWANFLSASPSGMTVKLDAAPVSLFIGHNGSGKSSVLDAIHFALFGTAFRPIPKTKLVSWAHGEAALVTLEFDLNGVPFVVRRGIDPNLFEVSKAGQKLALPGKLIDQQAHFEANILRLSAKSTQQIVMLGKAGYTPFLKLDAASRRAVVEDILDIAIFSRMSEELKPKIAALKTDRTEAQHAVRIAETKLDTITQAEAKAKVSHAAKLDRLREEITDAKKEHEAVKVPKAPDAKKLDALTKERDAVRDEITKRRMGVQTAKTALASLAEDDVCSMCGQPLTKKHAIDEQDKWTKLLAVAEDILVKAQAALPPIEKKLKVIEAAATAYRTAVSQQAVISSRISTLERQATALAAEKPPEVPDRAPVEAELTAAKKKAQAIERTFDLCARAATLLKDDGIKASVVRRFLPALNAEINAILARFGVAMRFSFDATFEESIRMRYLYDCPANSLSEGQKLRVELAILLAWRNIAAKQASIDTNLLIMDEVLDGSLDEAGCAELLKVLREMSNNVIIISHRKEEEFDNAFSRVLRFDLVGDYSAVTEILR